LIEEMNNYKSIDLLNNLEYLKEKIVIEISVDEIVFDQKTSIANFFF
jgi:hypothetical protein